MARDSNRNSTVETYSVELEDTERSPTAAVVESVAALTNRKPETLPPLAERIDPDALDTLLGQSTAASGCQIRFRYHGYHVEVNGNDEVRLTPLDDFRSGR